MKRVLALLFLLFAAPALAQDQRPLFELGLAGGAGYTPDYPAAEQSHVRGIVSPWLIYRGRILRADEQGARARTLLGDGIELAISASGSFPTASRDNRARAGMPDLDWIGEIGPTLIWTVWRDLDAAAPRRVVLETPLRAAFSTDLTSISYRGLTFEPDIAFQQRHLLVRGSRLRVSLGAVFANDRYMEYFYGVAPEFARAGRPAYAARAGYLGTRVQMSFRVPITETVSLVAGGRVFNHSGASNRDSPLFRRVWNYSVAAGFSWTLYRSGTLVDSSSEPFD